MARARRTLAAFLLLALLVATFAAESSEESAPTSADAGKPSDENLRAVVEGNGVFARNFYQVVRGTSGNLVISPLSAGSMLTLAWLGAGGQTAAKLQDALQLPADPQRAKAGFHALLQSLQFVDNSVTLDMASEAFVRRGLRLQEAFSREAAEVLLAGAREVDFSTPPAAAADINQWVQEKTRNKIEKLFDPDDLSPATAIVLANAVYFKGTWLTQFDPSFTQTKPFNVDAKTKSNVPLMYTAAQFPYAALDSLKARAVRLPYVGGRVSMVILLPNAVDGLSALESAMATTDLPRMLESLQEEEVHIWLPKFKIETSLTLNLALTQLGLGDIFGSQANFSGIIDGGAPLSEVVQKAIIEVNEEGSEAAAATGGIFLLSAGAYNFFKADHPFLFFIIDDQMGTVLFQGRFTKP